MEIRLWTSPPVQEKVHIIFKCITIHRHVQIKKIKLRTMAGLNVHYITPF